MNTTTTERVRMRMRMRIKTGNDYEEKSERVLNEVYKDDDSTQKNLGTSTLRGACSVRNE